MPPEAQETIAEVDTSASVDGGSDPSIEAAVAAADQASADAAETAGDASPESSADAAKAEAPPSEAATRKLNPAKTAQQPTNKTKPGGSHGGAKAPASQPQQPPAKPALDPQQAFNNERAQWGRERQQAQAALDEMRSKIATFERAEAERRAEAQRMALKAWHPRHPDYQATRDRIGRAKLFEQAASAIPADAPDYQQRIAKLARDMRVTKEDAQLAEQFDVHQEAVNREFAESPDGFISQRIAAEVPALIQQAFNQFSAYTKAQAEVQHDWADPKTIAPHADWIREQLVAKVPYPAIKEGVAMRNKIAELEAKLQGSTGREAEIDAKAKSAAERQRLAKGAATITRDTKTVGKPDVYTQAKDWAKANNVAVGSAKFNKRLRDLEEAAAQLDG